MKANRTFDGLLVLQYKAGEKQALAILVKRYHHKFCKQAFWYTKDKEASKDIAQESWDSILRNIRKLKNENSFGSWSMQIVTRKALDYVKNNQKELQKNKELYLFKRIAETISEAKEDNRTLLREAISQLSDKQKIVLRLFYTQEYSIKEISEIMMVSEGTVKSRLFNAREKLKSILKNK